MLLQVWDCEKKILTLARDKLEKNPILWLAKQLRGARFLFGSDLASFCKHPDFKEQIDINSLGQLLRYNYIHSPKSIYKDIYKLEPGKILTLNTKNRELSLEKYWSIHEIISKGINSKFNIEDSLLISNLEEKLKESVKGQMKSDVPLGAFLSGGIDSSTVVTTLMQSISSKPVKTFSIGFKDQSHNEAPKAKEIAKHLQTDHTEMYLSPKDCLEIIPELSSIYTEPFADSSQIPTYLVSNLARKKVKVSLSGDGGDEIFGGYNRYISSNRYWSYLRLMPLSVREKISTILIKNTAKSVGYYF